MIRYLAIVLGAASLVASGMTWASNASDAANLTTTQIIERNIAARGGLKAWRAVTTLTMSGKLEAGGTKNSELPFVLEMKRPYKSRLELHFRDQTALQVYDGTQGWKYRPFLGRNDIEPFNADETKAAADWEELDGPLIDHQRKGIKVALQGVDKVDGHTAYKLELTMKDGTKRHLWIDASSFLELKIDGQPRRLDGRMRHVAIYYLDYKTEQGLVLPHTFKTVVDGAKQPHEMHIDQVVVNKAINDNQFAKPTLAMLQTMEH